MGHLALDTGVYGRYERVVAILQHTDGQAGRESFSGGVEVADHDISPQSPH